MLRLKEGFSGERIIVLPEIIKEQQQHDPLVSSLYITDIGYYPHAEHHYRERNEPIAEDVLIYCVNGRGHYRLDGKEYDVKTNQYFILPSGQPHAYWSDAEEPWTIYWIHFSGSHSPYYTEGASSPKDVKPGLTSRISDRNNIFEEIFFTLNAGYSQENLRYASSLLHYYLGSMRFLQQFRMADPTDRLDSTTLVAATIHYMKENLEHTLELQDIADFLGYSVSHLSASFKKATGQSPLSYFNRMKIDRSCELLLTTDMKIKQISFKIGIDDPYYFSRLFSKTTGMSPREYREQAAQSNDKK